MTTTITVAEQLGREADSLIRRELARSSARPAALASGSADELWTATAAAGWFDVLLAEEFGGLGLTIEAAGALFTVIGRRLVPGPYLDHIVMVPMLYRFAPTSVRSRLDRARTGTDVIVLADPEAARGDADERPVVLQDRTLAGQINLVRHASNAAGFVVIAESTNGAVAVFVDASSPGVTVTPRESFDPTSAVADVRFDDVQLPDDSMFQAAGAGAAATAIGALRATLRMMIAAELAGLSRHLLDSSVGYAKIREQFGRPIGSFQPVQQLLADMASQVIGIEAFTADCVAHRAPDPAAAVLLKGFAARVARQVGEAALQVHGGIAFTEEFEGNRWFLRALTLQGLYGDDAISFREIGHALLNGSLQP